MSVVLGIAVIGLLSVCCAGNEKNKAIKNAKKSQRTLVTALLLCLVAILTWHHAQMAAYKSTDVLNSLNNYAIVNGCSDNYTRVDVDRQTASIESGNTMMKTAVMPCVYTLLSVTGLNLFVLIMLPMFIKPKNMAFSPFEDD